MKQDPRVLYPGTSFYGGGMTAAPFGGPPGLTSAPAMRSPAAPSVALSGNSGNSSTPPLSTVFGQATVGPWSTIR